MIKIEGLHVKGKSFSRKQLLSIWKRLSEEPFPKVKAFLLDDTDFDRVLEMRRCGDDEIREIEEWGRILSLKGTDACVFNPEGSSDFDYVVLVRQNPYHEIDQILEHELSHIVRGDL